MELTTISTVSKSLNVSTRTLRYYEEVGLIKSSKMPDYSYRVYDENTVKKIQQILILRKLSLSLKQIQLIFENDDAKYAMQVFMEKIDEIDSEVDALNSIKSVIVILVDRLKHSVDFDINTQFEADGDITEILCSLTPSKNTLKEKKQMEDIKKASEVKDTIENVRIVYLPPATVASSHYIGPDPEDNAANALDNFIKQSSLTEVKPDLRVYGFNNPCLEGDEEYGYEFWVTIPEDMEVTQSLKKKTFAGGMYAAYSIKMGDFHLWQPFYEWVMSSKEYDYDAREPLSMGGSMEEHLNAYGFYTSDNLDRGYIHLDLLIPIKEKE